MRGDRMLRAQAPHVLRELDHQKGELVVHRDRRAVGALREGKAARYDIRPDHLAQGVAIRRWRHPMRKRDHLAEGLLEIGLRPDALRRSRRASLHSTGP